ncbi:hypothetical protein ACUH91_03270 [Dermabacteraceae bacterium P9123]
MSSLGVRSEKDPLAFSLAGEKRFKKVSLAAQSSIGSVVIVDFIAGFLLVGDGYQFGSTGLNVSLISVALIAFAGFIRGPRESIREFFPAIMGICVLLSWTLMVSFMHDIPSEISVKRFLRIFAVVLATIFIAEKRIDWRSLIKGFIVGAILNIAMFYSGLAPDTYGGFLTGFLGDKNKAGLYYAVGGILAATIFKKKVPILLCLMAVSAAVWFTGSRTSLAGLSMGILWIFIFSKLPWLGRALAAVGVAFMVSFIEENYARVGAFASRLGSDRLRERIDSASSVKLSNSPFEGLGFGEAIVNIDGNNWFFHNSYATLQVEGGWPYLVGVLLITAWVSFGFFRDEGRTFLVRVSEGAAICMFVCAWKLGEVFLTNAWMLVVAAMVISLGEARKVDN